MTAFRTYGQLRLTDGDRWLLTELEPHVAIRLKQLFPRLRKDETKRFLFPNDQPTCADLDWFCSRYPMRMPDGERALLEKGRIGYEETLSEMERILSLDYRPPAYAGLREGQAIRTYQSQAIEVLRRRNGLLLGDDLGLGKTYTSAGFMLLPEARPAAVVVQTHLPGQWRHKLEEFTTLRVHEIKGTKPYSLPDSTDVFVYRYTQLAGWVDVFATGPFKTATFDEVQELRRGTESEKGRGAKVLCDNVDFRLGMSATPIYNYGGELWNIMNCLAPEVLGPHADFVREWCTAVGNGKYAVCNPEALGTYLREQHVFLRRTKKDVGQQVPPVNPLVEHIETDGKALADIADIARKLALATTTGSFISRGQAARELDMRVRHATGVSKAKPVAAYVRILLEASVPLILAGWHRDVYDIWMEELADFNPVMYTGTESPAQKAKAEAAFKSGDTNLMIISLRSGAGLDGLQFRCSTAVFGELDWSAEIHKQLVGRLDREGQTEQVTAIYLNSEDGSDPPMVELLGLKASQAAGIVDPGLVVAPISADYSRIRALAQQFLDRRQMKEFDAAAAIPPASVQDQASISAGQMELVE